MEGQTDNTKEWTGQSMSSLLRMADDSSRLGAVAADASIKVPQQYLGVTGVISRFWHIGKELGNSYKSYTTEPQSKHANYQRK